MNEVNNCLITLLNIIPKAALTPGFLRQNAHAASRYYFGNIHES